MIKNPNVTFVTAFIKLSDGPFRANIHDYVEYFAKLVAENFRIICYIHNGDPDIKELLAPLRKHENLSIVEIDKNQLQTFKIFNKQTTLPKNRTIQKDTLEFLQLMNAKSELVHMATNTTTDTSYFAWIDFAIAKIIKNWSATMDKLAIIKPASNKLTIPGCWTQRLCTWDKVSWRFCGGFFIGDRPTIKIFQEKNVKMIAKYNNLNRLTWETNIWAEMETTTPDLFDWYLADHNDTMFVCKMPNKLPIQNNRVILVTMVKNEERVLERLISSTLFCVDAVLVSDTGSTDKTCEIVDKLSRELTIPVSLAKSEWKHFGYNRSQAFLQAQIFCNKLGWDPKTVWGLLLDGDMILHKGDKYNKDALQKSGYMFTQKNDVIDYFNTRLVRLSDSWTCVGVTHEYWGGPSPSEKLGTDFLWIKDIGDGGCKADKFKRDIRLLEQGIIDEPNNVRYYFYLAQSYKDVGKFKKAIELYKVRIAKGGWAEEVWHSYYMIAKCYKELGDPHKTELWGNRAYNFRPCRAEPIYMLTQMFRTRGENFKAYHYYQLGKKIPYPNEDVLFIEKNIYAHLFDYEYTVIQYYTQPMNRLEGAKASMRYIRETRQFWESAFRNFQFYASRLCEIPGAKWESLHFKCPDSDFKPSSISLLRYNGRLIANVRFVNYIINDNGSYNMREKGRLASHHHVRTKNGFVFFGDDLKQSSELFMMKDSIGLPARNVNIKGVEDVRLFEHKSDIYYTGATKEYSPDGCIRMVMGRYDFHDISYKDSAIILPPTHTVCEKNWIAMGNSRGAIDIIHKWHPLEIGRVNNGKLEIAIKHDTPYYFHNVRGSSSVIEFEDMLWCVTHSVIYTTPRKYLHNIVVLEKRTFNLHKYSIPFCFTNTRIEYCLGFIELDGNFIFTFSIHDADPRILSVPVKWVKENLMDW